MLYNTKLTLLFMTLGFITVSTNSMATEEIFTRTPEDTIQVRTLPAARWMTASSSGSYFQNSGNLFGKLFNFIRDNDVSMTVPVEGNLTHAEMRFYVGQSDKRNLADTDEVRVIDVSERKVVSMGATGSYSEENIKDVYSKLKKWLASQSEWIADGAPYAVFWNGPMTLWLLKHFEVHIPIKSNAQ